MAVKIEFKQRCLDIFKQNWHADLWSNSQCTVYRQFKKEHALEKYLANLAPNEALQLSMFRMRVHQLPITRNRFNKAPVDTECPLCDSCEPVPLDTWSVF